MDIRAITYTALAQRRAVKIGSFLTGLAVFWRGTVICMLKPIAQMVCCENNHIAHHVNYVQF